MYPPEECRGLLVFDCDDTLWDPLNRACFEGIPELLQKLVKEKFCIVVWTGRSRSSCFKLFKEFGILSYFWEIYCGDDLIVKPYPGEIVELANTFEKKIMIGDLEVDHQAAQTIQAHFLWAGLVAR